MTEWGVRLEENGKPAAEFKVPAGEAGARDYIAAITGNAFSHILGDKATLLTRPGPDDAWTEVTE